MLRLPHQLTHETRIRARLLVRFSAEAGAYGVPEVESALRKQPEDRLHRDLQVVTNWLGQQVRPV